jgi:hypothetical protein
LPSSPADRAASFSVNSSTYNDWEHLATLTIKGEDRCTRRSLRHTKLFVDGGTAQI